MPVLWLERRATVAVAASGAALHRCIHRGAKVDSGSYAACSSPVTTGLLGDGPHTFYVRATDTAGNTDATPDSRAFSVDATAPETTIDSGPSGPTNDPTPTFGFSSDDGAASFECKVDSGSYAACTSPATTGSLSDGPHTFYVRATDAVGNTDATPDSRSFTVDTTAPVVPTLIAPANSSTTGNASPTLDWSSEAASGATNYDSERVSKGASCDFSGATPVNTASDSAGVGPLSDGAYCWRVRSVDAYGNASAYTGAFEFSIVTIVDAVNDGTSGSPFATLAAGSTNNSINVLANDAVASGTLSVGGTTTSGGTVTTCATCVGGGPGVRYTPDAFYAGLDSFTYTIDNGLSNDTATVWVLVEAGQLGTDVAMTDADLKPLKDSAFGTLFTKGSTKTKVKLSNTYPGALKYRYAVGREVHQNHGFRDQGEAHRGGPDQVRAPRDGRRRVAGES